MVPPVFTQLLYNSRDHAFAKTDVLLVECDSSKPVMKTLKTSAVTTSHIAKFLSQSLRQCVAAAATANAPGIAFMAIV